MDAENSRQSPEFESYPMIWRYGRATFPRACCRETSRSCCLLVWRGHLPLTKSASWVIDMASTERQWSASATAGSMHNEVVGPDAEERETYRVVLLRQCPISVLLGHIAMSSRARERLQITRSRRGPSRKAGPALAALVPLLGRVVQDAFDG